MPNIRQTLLIGAPATTVYEAITTQEGLSDWWTPEVIAKPERGSVAQFGFQPRYVKRMEIVDLRPQARVEWRCLEGADEWKGTILVFDLDPGDSATLRRGHPEMSDQLNQLGDRAEATLLAFRHDGWQDYTPMFAECSYTWGQFLRGLRELCEGGRGRPWPTQHRPEAA